MAFLFVGGEDIDFEIIGNVTVGTVSASFRPAYARCSLNVRTSSESSGIRAVMSAPSADFFFRGNVRILLDSGIYAEVAELIAFYSGGTKAFAVCRSRATTLLTLVSYTGTTPTVVATSTAGISTGTLRRLDIKVTVGTNGAFRIYLDQVVILDYAGPVEGNGATTINRVVLRSGNNVPAAGYEGCWSEVIIAERDTRTLHLKTLPPNGDGASTWIGSYSEVDEIVSSEVDTIYSDTADQIALMDLTGMPAGDFSVRAVKVSAHAVRSETGPTGIQLGVGSETVQAFTETIPVDQGWQSVTAIFERNPTNDAAWTPATVETLKLALKSQ